MYDMILHQDLPGTIKLKCSSKHRVPKHGPLKANGFKVRPTMCSYQVYLPCFTICHMHLPYLFTLFYHGFTMVYHNSDHSPHDPTWISHKTCLSGWHERQLGLQPRIRRNPESRGPWFDVMSKKWCLKGSQQKMNITWSWHYIEISYRIYRIYISWYIS